MLVCKHTTGDADGIDTLKGGRGEADELVR